jgi:hypothetical protein
VVITAEFLVIVGVFLATMTYVFVRGGAVEAEKQARFKKSATDTD